METNIVISVAAVLVALIAALITSRHSSKSLTLSTETARKDREDMRVSDAQEKGAFLQKVNETTDDIDKVGRISRTNRDDIQQLKVNVSVGDERMANVQSDIKDLGGKIDRLVDIVVKSARGKS